jgi:hypothetical protein
LIFIFTLETYWDHIAIEEQKDRKFSEIEKTMKNIGDIITLTKLWICSFQEKLRIGLEK